MNTEHGKRTALEAGGSQPTFLTPYPPTWVIQ